MAQPFAEFVHGNLRLLGCSLAGEETYIVAPELNLAFDVGRAPRDTLSVDHVFLTHGHMDHAAGIAYYFSQRMFIDNQPGHVYLPRPLVDPVKRLLRVWADVDGHEPPANVHAVEPGVDVVLRRDLVVRPFEVRHPCHRHDRSIVRALGYAAVEVRQKLIDEYQNLTGPQLVELKKQGHQIARRVEIPLVAYCGDTAAGSFLELDCVRRAKVLLLECTFVEADHVERARAGYHMHVHDLPAVLSRLENEQIALIHLSRRTALPVARAILQKELGAQFGQRVTLFMDHRPPRRRAVASDGAGAAPSGPPRNAASTDE